MKSILKRVFLRICWIFGFFYISKILMRKKLQILCYHGFEIQDESKFNPKLFIRKETFSKRLKLISKYKFPVLSLNEAMEKLKNKELPNNALVITIDDGFYSVYNVAVSMLRSYRYPATVYITTYYVQKETPVFRLIVQYMFWKTKNRILNLRGCAWSKDDEVALTDEQTRNRVMWECIDYGEQKCSETQRVEIGRALGELLDCDYQQIKDSRIVSLVNKKEVKKLAKEGFDIQLHTHRHCFPSGDETMAMKEILENKQYLEEIVGYPLFHFCYPSGVWNQHQWPWLKSLGIQSATTCLAGLNDTTVPALALGRFVDGENISQIEFTAELFGFMELLRLTRNTIKRINRVRGN